MGRFASFAECMTFLDGLGLFRMELGLARMEAFAAALGRAPRFRILHVVGTNGKGSTSTFLAELLHAHGLRTGLSTSPHFVSPRERIQVDGEPLPEAAWLAAANDLADLRLDLTYFEWLTCLAVLLFEAAGVEAAVMEAGLGGRFDATNVFRPDLTLFTPVGLDHQAVLGPTLADISRDKAGAMRPGGTAATSAQSPEALAVLRAEAEALGCRLFMAHDLVEADPGAGFFRFRPPLPPLALSGVRLGLAGPHQAGNARLALAGLGLFAHRTGFVPDAARCRAALADAFIPGRLQTVPGRPALILDGAHNGHALAALARAVRDMDPRPQGLVFACLRDKNLPDMLPWLRELTDGMVVVAGLPGCERAFDPADLAALIGGGAEAAPDLFAALDRFSGLPGPVLVCGSLYLAAEFYTTHPRFLRRDEARSGRSWNAPEEDS